MLFWTLDKLLFLVVMYQVLSFVMLFEEYIIQYYLRELKVVTYSIILQIVVSTNGILF
jgi:hypothetical protein